MKGKSTIGLTVAGLLLCWAGSGCTGIGEDTRPKKDRVPRGVPKVEEVVEEAPSPPKEEPEKNLTAEGNEIVIKCVDEGASTYEKKACQKENTGKNLEFVGKVHDINKDKLLDIKLDSGNYAKVKFRKKIADKVEVGNFIKFKGKVTSWGSGIIFPHEIRATEWSKIE